MNDEGKGINQDPITGNSFDASNMDLIEKRLLELEEAPITPTCYRCLQPMKNSSKKIKSLANAGIFDTF